MIRIWFLVSTFSPKDLCYLFSIFYKDRLAEIQRLLNISKNKKTAAAMLLSSEAAFTPFDVSEVSFGVIGPYCLAR